MRIPVTTVLFTASMLAAPAFAQTLPSTSAPAPQPTVSAPAVLPGAPVAPLTTSDAQFVSTQLERNLAEMQAAQLALQHSQDQNVRNFAQKMLTDHGYAENTLMPIAEREHIAAPTAVSPQDRSMLDQLASLSGASFDRAYVNGMVRSHTATIAELNDQLVHGQSQQINAWVQNTRPVVLQHSAIAQQLLATLPRTG